MKDAIRQNESRDFNLQMTYYSYFPGIHPAGIKPVICGKHFTKDALAELQASNILYMVVPSNVIEHCEFLVRF